MDKIKESFHKVKEDISSLYSEIYSLRGEFEKIRGEMVELCEILGKINEKIDKNTSNEGSTHSTNQTTNTASPTYSSTHILPLEALKPLNLTISTRNEGVPTDKQTDKQTDRQSISPHLNNRFSEDFNSPEPEQEIPSLDIPKDSIDDATRILDSLDSIKKEVRLKFKRLTDQEILVFSTLYQLDEEMPGQVNYRLISKKLNLTESSIRDYVGRLIKKGIPVDKKRINNKNISLSISPNLKKIASLPTILQLRDI